MQEALGPHWEEGWNINKQTHMDRQASFFMVTASQVIVHFVIIFGLDQNHMGKGGGEPRWNLCPGGPWWFFAALVSVFLPNRAVWCSQLFAQEFSHTTPYLLLGESLLYPVGDGLDDLISQKSFQSILNKCCDFNKTLSFGLHSTQSIQTVMSASLHKHIFATT